MTTLVSTPLQFTRRVSFNNLQPQKDDDLNLKPIYNLTSVSSSAPIAQPIKFNNNIFDPSYITGEKKPVFNSNISRRKRLKLPDPPSKSILKNKLSPEQISTNLTTIQYHDDQIVKDICFTDDNIEITTGKPAPQRRKSYAGMTDEELLALDPQYNTTRSKTSSIDQFKFDSQKTYYLSTPKKTTTSAPKPNTTYPTSNVNNYKSINLTVKHNNLDQIKYSRTLLTIISGRRHTWNSIDWLFSINQTINESSSFLQDGDYLIITALIPRKFTQSYNSKKLDEYLYKKCENLLNYFLSNQNLLLVNDLKIKLTIEFVLDNSDDAHKTGYKYMINNLCNQYQPNLLIIGTKSSNFNFKYPIQFEQAKNKNAYLIRLSSYIIKYSPVPVILVGQGTKYHNFAELEKRRRSSTLRFEGDPIRGRDRSNSSSMSSTNSLDSVELVEGKEELASVTSNIMEKVENFFESDSNDRFANLISLISDNSINNARNYFIAIKSKNDSLKIDPKIHSIYRSQNQVQYNGLNASKTNSRDSEQKAYRIKSLLGSEEPAKKESKVSIFVSTPETPSQMKKRQASVSSGAGSVSGPSASGINHDSSKSKSTSMKSIPKSDDKSAEKKKGSIWKKLGFKK